MRKKVDARIRNLIDNGVKNKHRSMFVIVGDKFYPQIVNLCHLMTKATLKAQPEVLWCYKNKLDISSHRKKREKQAKKLKWTGFLDPEKTGFLDPEKIDSYLLFYETVKITNCFYKGSEKILGKTYSMCILQDFEALTPNLLARTLETVEGGGLIILLLRSLSSLTSLYTMAMDVHERFRTESHFTATGRFNERFLLSLASCTTCVVTDDELNILPISSHIWSTKPALVQEDSDGLSDSERDLKKLKDEFSEVDPVGSLIRRCCTLDQALAVTQFLDTILEKTFRNTLALLSARGRGKSAALGLSVAGAVAARYSNIFVTAPTPENLQTLFEFVLKGFDALKYEKHNHYNVVRSSDPEFKKAIVRIDIYKHDRQTIQYIQPHEHEKLSQVDLLVIDEAAAIPLPVVKSLFGPYTVFLSSTINGYEGTGRSLSLKLLEQLEKLSPSPDQRHNLPMDGHFSGRIYKKLELNESIRYASGDPVESWLHSLLCLDVTSSIPHINRLPPRDACALYYVNRDTLFSYHKESELFLQRMMSLYVASHYKNSPNDLQLMADAPAHHLFVLLGPVDEAKNNLPDILVVIQDISEVCYKNLKSLSEGHQPHGDQIPWKFCEQFQDTVFPSFSGVRIVRIAVHPSAMRLGYGSTAVELLTRYYEGQFTSMTELDFEDVEEHPVRVTEAAEKASLLKENIKPRSNLPPLLVHLRERRPEKLHYIGVSFGLTLDLFRFWCKHDFAMFYICQIPNAVTGEHTCMVLKALKNDDVEASDSYSWSFVSSFYQDFRCRFIGLLGSTFRGMEYKLCMSILCPKPGTTSPYSGYRSLLDGKLSPHDMKRLETYTSTLANFHLILDLVPELARLYFKDRLQVSLTCIQDSILLCMGLKYQDVTYIEREMKLEKHVILLQFSKLMRKFYSCLSNLAANESEATGPLLREIVMKPHIVSVDDDLDAAAKDIKEKMKVESQDLMNTEFQEAYRITEGEVEFENALQSLGGKIPSSGITSVKSKRNQMEKHCKEKGNTKGSGRRQDISSSHPNKKRKSEDSHGSSKTQWLKACDAK